MGKRNSKPAPFEVICPDCGAVIKVDAETCAVIGHQSAARPKTFNDLDEAARAMHEQEGRRDSIFRQSVDAEKQRGDLLEKKFQEALRKAKESPDIDKPLIRDFDLD
jgi:adenine-specific DNA methylase